MLHAKRSRITMSDIALMLSHRNLYFNSFLRLSLATYKIKRKKNKMKKDS